MSLYLIKTGYHSATNSQPVSGNISKLPVSMSASHDHSSTYGNLASAQGAFGASLASVTSDLHCFSTSRCFCVLTVLYVFLPVYMVKSLFFFEVLPFIGFHKMPFSAVAFVSTICSLLLLILCRSTAFSNSTVWSLLRLSLSPVVFFSVPTSHVIHRLGINPYLGTDDSHLCIPTPRC